MLLALTIAGLCSLKNSLLAGCVFALAALWLASSHEVRWRRLVELSVAGVVAGLFLIPWMIELHRSSGTWFFPILGKGFHGSVYGSFPDVTAGLHFAGIVHTLVSFSWRSRETLALGILPLLSPLVIRGSKSRDYRSWVLLSLGTWVGAFILFIQSGTVRYGYPFVMAAIFFLLAEYLPTTAEIARRFEARRLAVAALLAFFLGINYREGLYPYVAAVARWDPQPDRHPYPYQNAQAAVPEGAIVLACLSHPFMLDFKRNPIYTVDHAGGASPPPGIPVLGSDEELVAYLRRQSVRYVMYSYSDEASYGRIDAGESLKAGGNAYDDRARKLAEYNIAFRDHLSALAQQGAKVFDDGVVFVLDLESLKQPIPG
jgi:uncharacterized membrane protein YhaH (DUF805 family)